MASLLQARFRPGSTGGQGFAGLRVYNEEQREHDEASVSLGEDLRTGHFVEAVFENWESEFLQMGLSVLLTAFLIPARLGRVEGPRPARGGG